MPRVKQLINRESVGKIRITGMHFKRELGLYNIRILSFKEIAKEELAECEM